MVFWGGFGLIIDKTDKTGSRVSLPQQRFFFCGNLFSTLLCKITEAWIRPTRHIYPRSLLKMSSDEIVWQVINQQFCSYKLK